VPNTLAHVGVQALATRAMAPGADLNWVYLGCIVPDLPWILQRIAQWLAPGPGLAPVDPYLLHGYAIVQSTLAMSLVLCLALACLASRPGRAFAIVAANAGLHLLLDTVEVKWANGVHLFAPLDWRLLSLGWWWPESLPIHLLSALGLGVLGMALLRDGVRPIGLDPRPHRVLGLCLPLLLLYFALPIAFLDGPAGADNHFGETLRQRELRPGRYIEIDRDRYSTGASGPRIETFAGESLTLEGIDIAGPALVSLRGRFASADRIVVEEYHVHPRGLRDLASYIGLALIAACWARDRLRRGRPGH
jgi:hypothetical protein